MDTITLDALHDRMLAKLKAGGGYEFLGLAAPYLVACPGDHYARLMAVQEYLKLGLVKPAQELIAAGAAIRGAPAEFGDLCDRMSGMAGGADSWALYNSTFEANLKSLAGKGIDASAIRDSWALDHTSYELYRDRNGLKQVRVSDGRNEWNWAPGLGNHTEAADSLPLPDDSGGIMPGPYLFDGIELGSYFERVYDKTLDTFHGFSCALYILEPDRSALAAALHLRDWSGILSDPRVFVFVGRRCAEELRDLLERNVNLPWPQRSLTLSGLRRKSFETGIEVLQRAAAERLRAIELSAQELNARYASRDVHYWAKRFREALSGTGPPLRVISAVSTHTTFLQYSMRDVRRALEALGHGCVVLTEGTNHEVIGPLTYHDTISKLDPDVYFALDHLRPEFGSLIPKNLPILTWDQDCLPDVFTKEKLDRIAPHDFLAGCTKARFVQLGYDSGQYLSTSVPTSPEQFGGPALTEEERARYTCDVSYVSHASQTPREFHDAERTKCDSPKAAELLDTLFEMMPEMLRRHGVVRLARSLEMIDAASRRCGVEIRGHGVRDWFTSWYLWRLGDRFFRHEALEWVARWARNTGRTLRLYGKGWERHPSLGQFAAGPASNGRELLCIHRASRINLQLMPAGFIHQRAMDGLAGGGFFMARRVAAGTGETLRRLLARIRERGITTSHELTSCTDAELSRLQEDYLGGPVHRMAEYFPDLLNFYHISTEIDHAEDVFPRLFEVLFDSESEFVHKAEQFLADETLRASIAGAMRQTVVDRFSYRPTIDRFLHAMCDYLQTAARERAGA